MVSNINFGLDFDFLKSEYNNLVQALSFEQGLDRNKRAESQKRVAILQEIISIMENLSGLTKEINSYQEELDLESTSDFEYRNMLVEEISKLKNKIKILEKDLEDILFPLDPRNNKPCFLEIRAGAGGQEASIFANDLLKTYTAYALRKGWDATLHSISNTDLGGVREAILYVKGKQAYGELKFESGVHRVQRVPVTEGAGRIHTSTITVAVLPEADEIDVVINPNDLRVDVFRSTGAGGQHVNTTDSAVRITHIPTGVVVTCQDERSQIKNRAKAMKELRSRILEAQIQKADAERSSERKSKIGSGDRAEKIRTYNYPQNRITDHRIDLTLKKLDIIMAGDLSEIIETLQEEDNKNRQINPELSFLFKKQ